MPKTAENDRKRTVEIRQPDINNFMSDLLYDFVNIFAENILDQKIIVRGLEIVNIVTNK